MFSCFRLVNVSYSYPRQSEAESLLLVLAVLGAVEAWFDLLGSAFFSLSTLEDYQQSSYKGECIPDL